MRREDREVKGIGEIFDILNRCTTLSLGMTDKDGRPYVIPMTFGCEKDGETITVYLHSAVGGHKWEILIGEPTVCVEAHLYYQVEKVEGGLTARYESVIGTGRARRLTETADKIAGLRAMTAHYKNSGFPVSACESLPKTEVFRIRLTEVTGKRNL